MTPHIKSALRKESPSLPSSLQKKMNGFKIDMILHALFHNNICSDLIHNIINTKRFFTT